MHRYVLNNIIDHDIIYTYLDFLIYASIIYFDNIRESE